MEKIGKELKVSAIKNGTVLDHIPANQLFKVINILNLDNCPHQITFGTNLDSKLLGKKAIIKIADRYFEDDEINRIALVAPQAKINIIRDFEKGDFHSGTDRGNRQMRKSQMYYQPPARTNPFHYPV